MSELKYTSVRWTKEVEIKVFAWADQKDDLGWSTDGQHTFKSVYNHGLVDGANYGYWLARQEKREWPGGELLYWEEVPELFGDHHLRVAHYNSTIRFEIVTYNHQVVARVFIGKFLFDEEVDIYMSRDLDPEQWCLDKLKQITVQAPKT